MSAMVSQFTGDLIAQPLIKINEESNIKYSIYRQISNISRTLVGN